MEGELEEQLTPRKLAELHGWQEEHKRLRPAVYRRLLRELHQRMVEVLAARSERSWYSNTTNTMAPAKTPDVGLPQRRSTEPRAFESSD